MNPLRIKAAIALLLMVIAFAGAVAWKPTKHLADARPKMDLEALFPKQFGEWTLDTRVPVQLVSPDQAAVLNAIYSQTLSRTYTNPQGYRIMLSVAYGGDQSDATRAHRPEVCYPAQGFQIVSRTLGVLQAGNLNVPIRRLVAKQGNRVEPISYWIIVGDRRTVSTTEQKLAQLQYSVRGVIPDGMLVRVSSIDVDAPKAYAIQESFLVSLSTALSSSGKTRVFGIDEVS